LYRRRVQRSEAPSEPAKPGRISGPDRLRLGRVRPTRTEPVNPGRADRFGHEGVRSVRTVTSGTIRATVPVIVTTAAV